VENSVSGEHETTIELGFTLFSVNESSVNLECKNCSKVYKFNKTIFSETSKDECVPSDTIRCPNCGNTTHKNSKIQPKQSVQNASEAKESVPTNDKANDNSDPYAKVEPRPDDASKRDFTFDEKGNIVVKNPSAFWLPKVEIVDEIGGTEYTVTSSYDGEETLDKKLKRILEQNTSDAADD